MISCKMSLSREQNRTSLVGRLSPPLRARAWAWPTHRHLWEKDLVSAVTHFTGPIVKGNAWVQMPAAQLRALGKNTSSLCLHFLIHKLALSFPLIIRSLIMRMTIIPLENSKYLSRGSVEHGG